MSKQGEHTLDNVTLICLIHFSVSLHIPKIHSKFELHELFDFLGLIRNILGYSMLIGFVIEVLLSLFKETFSFPTGNN